MLRTLSKERFTADHLDEVQGFDCGDKSWQTEVSDWLKRPEGEEGAVTAILNKDRPSRVWLYRLEDRSLIGFGALGQSKWRWTKKKDPFLPLTIITWVAIQKKYWGLPKEPTTQKYSHQIMDDLIIEAMQDSDTHPVLGLMVSAENVPAIRLYKDYEFIDDLEPFTDKHTNNTYKKMALVLDGESVKRLITASR